MNLMKIGVCAALVICGLSAMADVGPVAAGSKEEAVANVAGSIFTVKNLNLNGWAYKIVSMDSQLNGDLNSTTMVLVGQKEVGGLAGFESAFQLSPIGNRRSLSSIKVVNNEIELTFTDDMAKPTLVTYVHYDPTSKILKESAKVYVPKHLVHSVGKAYTECTDASEQQQPRGKRQICVNAAGDFYYLAD